MATTQPEIVERLWRVRDDLPLPLASKLFEDTDYEDGPEPEVPLWPTEIFGAVFLNTREFGSAVFSLLSLEATIADLDALFTDNPGVVNAWVGNVVVERLGGPLPIPPVPVPGVDTPE